MRHLPHLLSTLALTTLTGSLHAATYYIDARSGNDLSDGLASSPSTSSRGPWQSFAKISSAGIRAGDTILLRCDSVWNETLTLTASGSVTAPITIASYPEGCSSKPEISGVRSVPAHAWQSAGGGIYRANVKWNRIANGSFVSSRSGWQTWSINGDAVLNWSSSCTTSGSACATLISGVTGSYGIASSSSFPLEGGKKYRIRYTLRGASGVPIKVYVRRASAPYDAVGYRKDFIGTEVWQQINEEFTAPVSIQNARLDVEVAPGKRSVQFGEIAIEPVDSVSVQQIILNNQALQVAHHPNIGHDVTQPASVYAHTGANSDSSIINTSPRSSYLITGSDLRLPTGVTLKPGINVIIRNAPWTLDERRAIAVSGTRIDLDSPTTYPITAGIPYYLTGALWMLDAPGEWFFDTTSGTISIWTPDGLPPDDRIKITWLDTGINLTQTSNINIKNISIRGVGLGFNLIKSKQITLDSISVFDTHTYGIRADNATMLEISEASINRTGNDAIYAPSSQYTQVIESDIENSSVSILDGAVRTLPRSASAAILAGQASKISGNRIINSGYNGIRVFEQSTIERNIVIDTCRTLNDCGGIYVSGYSSGTTVFENIVRNVHGNIDGMSPSSRYHAAGIYMDDHANNMKIVGNTISGANFGIHLHDGYDNLIQRNLIFGNRNHQLWMQEQQAKISATGDMARNQIINNSLFPIDGNIALMQESEITSIEGFGNFVDNRFSALISSSLIGEMWPTGLRSYTLSQWRSAKDSSGELKGDATFSEVRPSGYAATRVIGSNQIPNGSLLSASKGWTYWSQLAPSPTVAVESCSPGRCLRFNAGGSSSLLSTPNFSVIQGQSYRVSFDARTGFEGQIIGPVVRRGGPAPFYERLMAATQAFTGSVAWKRYTFTFRASKTVNANDPITGELGARVDFEQNSAGSTLWVSNVEIVPLQDTSATLRSHLIANESRQYDTFDCPEASTEDEALCSDYIHFADESPVIWPLSLAPNEANVVFTRISALLDSDGDGIADFQDKCAATTQGLATNSLGCTLGQTPSP